MTICWLLAQRQYLFFIARGLLLSLTYDDIVAVTANIINALLICFERRRARRRRRMPPPRAAALLVCHAFSLRHAHHATLRAIYHYRHTALRHAATDRRYSTLTSTSLFYCCPRQRHTLLSSRHHIAVTPPFVRYRRFPRHVTLAIFVQTCPVQKKAASPVQEKKGREGGGGGVHLTNTKTSLRLL